MTRTQGFRKRSCNGWNDGSRIRKNSRRKSKKSEVKDFGKMMVDDHSKANDDLKDVASKRI